MNDVQPDRSGGLWMALLAGMGVVLILAACLLATFGPRTRAALARPTPTLTMTPTRTPRPTVSPTPAPRVEREPLAVMTEAPTITPIPSPTPGPIPTIVWTEAERNALSWLCLGEVKALDELRVDACLSVLSTVRQRYAYPSAFNESSVAEVLAHPGQFNVTIHTDRPAPDPAMMQAVLAYESGARGSCTGYLYFNSTPGGPSLCVIRSADGSYIEFHNGW
jgi:hypothetical protein